MTKVFESDLVDSVHIIKTFNIPQNFITKPVLNVITKGNVGSAKIVSRQQGQTTWQRRKFIQQLVRLNLNELGQDWANIREIMFKRALNNAHY